MLPSVLSDIISGIFLIILFTSGIFLFFVTGTIGPLHLPDSYAKHCEACGTIWHVIYRRWCPKCGILLSQSNMFTTVNSWKDAKELSLQDKVHARAFELAEQKRENAPRKK